MTSKELIDESIRTSIAGLFQRWRVHYGLRTTSCPQWINSEKIETLQSQWFKEISKYIYAMQQEPIHLFLDDIRDPPEGFSGIICRTAVEAIELLSMGNVQKIYFDHDLGTHLTGYDVAKWIEQAVYDEKISCPEWSVHSANPVGVDNITSAMQSAERIQNRKLNDKYK